MALGADSSQIYPYVPKKHHRALIIIIILVLLLISSIIWGRRSIYLVTDQSKEIGSSIRLDVKDNPQVSQVPFDQLPQGFLQSVYTPGDAILVENTNTTLHDGRMWATRGYKTNTALAALPSEYEKYLASLGGVWSKPSVYQRGEDNVFLSTQNQKDKKLLVVYLSKSQTANLIRIIFADTK